MAPDKIAEKKTETADRSEITTDYHPTANRRSIVAERYKASVEERKSNPDRVFYDGEDLKHLDEDFVALDSSKQENPRSWTNRRKWVATTVVGFYVFLVPFTSTIFAPGLGEVMASIGETDTTLGALIVSIFLLGFAIAPLIQAPLSEMYGRKPVLSVGNAIFIVFSIGAGFCKTTSQLVLCRFFGGCGGAAALAVFGGVLADIWDLRARAKATGILASTINLGPVLGPLCGGWITLGASWQWTCWIPAMAAAGIELIAFFWLKECYAPTLLRQKLKKARFHRPESYTALDLRDDNLKRGARALLGETQRPIVYLLLQPGLALLSFYYSVIFGTFYLVVITFYSVFGAGGYGHSTGIVGVDLLSEGVGAVLGTIATVKLFNILYDRQDRSKESYKHESRLIAAFGGGVLTAAGLFVYGFTALKTHFMVPLVGIAIFCFGVINTFLAIQLYCIDAFDYPASAVAALSFLRCAFAAVFPLFGQRLFDALGVDWGVGLLGFLTLGIGIPFVPLVYYFGPRLREVGQRNIDRFGLPG